MTSLNDMIGDVSLLGKMTPSQFDSYWHSLGVVVHALARVAVDNPEPAAEPELAKGEVANVAAGTERAWQPSVRRPLTAFGFAPGRDHDAAG